MMAIPQRVKRETKTKAYDYKARHGANPHDIPMGANDVPTVNAVVAFQFHGDEITTFEVDGEPYVAMRRIVENLGMAWGRQQTKLMEQETKFNCTLMCTVGADGKRRDMLSIPLAKLPLWLASINPNKVPDLDARAKIELYQEESAKALYDFWFKGGGDRLATLEATVASMNEMLVRLTGMQKMTVHKVTGLQGDAIEIKTLASRELDIDAIVARAVDERIMSDDRRAALKNVSLREILNDEYKVPTKGRRSLQRKIFVRLSAYCLENRVSAYRCSHSGTWLFDRVEASRFVRERCAGLIADHIAKLNGQGVLRLVVSKPKGALRSEDTHFAQERGA